MQLLDATAAPQTAITSFWQINWTVSLIVLAVLVLVVAGYRFYRHQSLLCERAELMRTAIRHRDFMFRLPTKGLLFGERALQEALNDLGQDILKLTAHNEVESWQRLTRVLTHEIMNATAPIQSISQAYLSQPDIVGSPYEEGIRAIHDTSIGLAVFVESYRKLTQLQDPVLGDVNLRDFLNGITKLYPTLQWEIDVPGDLTIRADASMLRQVFINMTKNAIEAQTRRMTFQYKAKENGQFGQLTVSNNGHIIPSEVVSDIFIPFFTTKPSGSGIGLALSRQILMMHGMTLSLRKYPITGHNVTFVIESER